MAETLSESFRESEFVGYSMKFLGMMVILGVSVAAVNEYLELAAKAGE
ncbi:MAG: hypothetical protein PVJ52_02655 [Candidatus Woesebacteria bacterium]|jgi:hypothetical protein